MVGTPAEATTAASSSVVRVPCPMVKSRLEDIVVARDHYVLQSRRGKG
jgi:hypothetical protein